MPILQMTVIVIIVECLLGVSSSCGVGSFNLRNSFADRSFHYVRFIQDGTEAYSVVLLGT